MFGMSPCIILVSSAKEVNGRKNRGIKWNTDSQSWKRATSNTGSAVRQAVLVSTIEWVSGPLRLRREAEQSFCSAVNKDFEMVCESAGMNPEALSGRGLDGSESSPSRL